MRLGGPSGAAGCSARCRPGLGASASSCARTRHRGHDVSAHDPAGSRRGGRAIPRLRRQSRASRAASSARGCASSGWRLGKSTSRGCVRCSRCMDACALSASRVRPFAPGICSAPPTSGARRAGAGARCGRGPPRRRGRRRPIRLLWKDTFAAYQWGWDPAWARSSMGSVLTYHAIASRRRRGAHARLPSRDGGFEDRFGAVYRDDRTWIVPRGPAGLLLSARYRARDGMRPRRRPEPFACA